MYRNNVSQEKVIKGYDKKYSLKLLYINYIET
jgi:hypothetical protein